MISGAKVQFLFHRTKFSPFFLPLYLPLQNKDVPLHTQTESSAVGSALRSGRRGRAFESPLSDTIRGKSLLLRIFCLRNAVCAVADRACAIRPCNFRKSTIAHFFQNTPKITFDVGKTMSYAGKIMSDIIQTTSDLFSAVSSS